MILIHLKILPSLMKTLIDGNLDPASMCSVNTLTSTFLAF